MVMSFVNHGMEVEQVPAFAPFPFFLVFFWVSWSEPGFWPRACFPPLRLALLTSTSRFRTTSLKALLPCELNAVHCSQAS